MASNRLALTWFNQDKAVLPDGAGGYKWVEKNDPRLAEVRLLTEVERVGETDGTAADNLLILGDAYDALHALSRIPEYADQYRGQVKLVYIDPPFNTKQAFDNYDDNFDHSIWLSMFRDRVRLLAEMLREDGSIWVHLDDTEVHRARMVLDEVFGIGNFLATIAWEKDKGRRNDTHISSAHDYILVYSPAGKSAWKEIRNLLPRNGGQIARYQNPDNDPRGPWLQGDNGTAKSGKEQNRFRITLPSGRVVTPGKNYWRFSPETLEAARRENRVWFGRDGDSLPVIKRYLTDVQDGLVPRTLWTADEAGHNQEAKRDHINKMFPDHPTGFATPKPERLLERIIHIGSDPGDIVLDCYAGSGTTAAVAHKLGRRWVAIEAIAETVEDFVRPRLGKVVDGTDFGGISTSKLRVSDLDLPGEMTAKDLDQARKTLEQLADAGSLDVDEAALKELISQLTTRPSTERVWHGGGGFRWLKVEASQLTIEENLPLLADVGSPLLPRFTAVQLGYRMVDRRAGVVGVKGQDVLVVVPGVVDEAQVEAAVGNLDEGETLTIAGLAIHPSVPGKLSELRPGSRAVKIPSGLVQRSTVVR